mgnify:CR=1 FL=1
MRHLSNLFDPRTEDARKNFTLSYHAHFDSALADREWEWHMKWVNENVIGRPHASEYYTVEQLEERGMVGLYKVEKNDVALERIGKLNLA